VLEKNTPGQRERAKDIVREKFNWEKSIEKYLRVINNERTR
jgi:hypothetical protein